MNKIFLLLPFFVLFFSCEEEGKLTNDKPNVVIEETANTAQNNKNSQYEGVFKPTSGIAVTGKLHIYLENANYKLRFENFSISNGPDLKVYLAKTDALSEYINLGNLKINAVYMIPNQVDLSTYKYVLVYCQQYSHLFAFAELTQK
jgi:hypothetical protein